MESNIGCLFSRFLPGLPTAHFIEAFFVGERGIKWPVQHRLCFFSGFTWAGRFIEAFFAGGGGIKWPVQHRLCFFRGVTWTVHFIEAFFVVGGGIKRPVQHRFFFQGFYLDSPLYRGSLCLGGGKKWLVT